MIISSYSRYFLELDNFIIGKKEKRGVEVAEVVEVV